MKEEVAPSRTSTSSGWMEDQWESPPLRTSRPFLARSPEPYVHSILSWDEEITQGLVYAPTLLTCCQSQTSAHLLGTGALAHPVSPSEMFPVVKLQRERKQKAKQKGRGGERELSRRVSPQVNLVNQRQPSLLSWQENILTTSKHLVVQSVIKNGGLSI